MNVVIGAGGGGLAAALHWRRQGLPVTVLETREAVGGLASTVTLDGVRHDLGPYVLLDRPGFAWAFARLGLSLADEVTLLRLPEPYRVERADAPTVSIPDGLDEAADGFERDLPGAGAAYRSFVREVQARYARLAPLQRAPFGGPSALLSRGWWRDALFLLRSLGGVLAGSGLPAPVQDALAVWTHVAGQPLSAAPSVMALVPGVIHDVGAFTVADGMGAMVDALARAAVAAGVDLRLGQRVDRIVRDGPRVVALDVGGRRMPVERVVCNAPALTALCDLLSPPEPPLSAPLRALPLQSPGVAAWLAVDPDATAPFLRFRLRDGGVVGLLHPGAVDPARQGRSRLFAPLDHAWAERVGAVGQRAALDALVAEPWWREGLGAARGVCTRIPVEWGRAHHLWRDSMNPTMTAAFLRRGRAPHRPPLGPQNLALRGAATHPGQWVSFCAISGILATAP